MRDWLKSIGQGLGGLGILVAALVYWVRAQTEMQAAAQERTGELVGLLSSVASEISINERTLDRLIGEPHRLVTPTEQVLVTRHWDQNALRIAQLLSDYGMFSPIAQYYECAQRLRESVRHGAATREDVDDFRENAEVCRQQGAVVRNRIFRYLAEVLAVEFAK